MEWILENEWCKLVCQEKGGEIASFYDKVNQVELMYQGNEGWGGKNPSLFPMVGNTRTEKYTIHGKEYSMKNHGLIRYATLTGRKEEDALIFTYVSCPESLAQYPFNFIYEIKYRLEGKKVLISYEIKNTSDEPMPFSFGLHPGFRVPQNDSETFEEYSLHYEKLENATQLIFDPEGKKPVEYKDVSFQDWKLSYDEIDAYATLVYTNMKSSYVDLMYKEEPRVRVSIEGFPYFALWTHPSHSHFLCIEPWYGHGDFEDVGDDFYHREGTMIIEPGESFHTEYFIENLR